jgi:preprotein translocase subunit SecY
MNYNEKQINTEENFVITESAKNKLITTFILIFLIRLGGHIQLPGINQDVIFDNLALNLSSSKFLTNFSDSIPNLFSLGIGPSINASIIMQLVLAINPELKKLQREEGEMGRKKISTYIRYITLLISIFQSIIFIFSLRPFLKEFNFYSIFEISCILTTGSMIVLWISEKITKNGITNGSSLLVFLTIVANVPRQIQASIIDINLLNLLLIIFTLMITVCSVIFLQQSIRYILIIKSKISMRQPNNNIYKQKAFFPCKLNNAGVMPIVFASYLLPIFTNLGSFILININSNFNLSIVFPEILNKILYFSLEFFLICLFTSFYSVVIIDPKDVSEDLQKAAFYIPGIRPGKQTFEFLEKLFQRQAFIGGVILAFNAVLLNLVGSLIKLPILQGIGIGSQIIVIGVIIEIFQKIRALMISEIYKKYLK